MASPHSVASGMGVSNSSAGDLRLSIASNWPHPDRRSLSLPVLLNITPVSNSSCGTSFANKHGFLRNMSDSRTCRQNNQSQAGEEHWETHEAFCQLELHRREENAGGIRDGRLFVSHSWRLSDNQLRKRRMIAEFSLPAKDGGPGMSYWADYLDLQSDGPVPWQQEIADGIETCSKCVCFIDVAYITSFNCLMEAAQAFACNKPVVVLIMDQESWELLTVPGGSAKAWEDSTWGAPPSAYEGCDFPGGETFCAQVYARLLARLSAINLCPCRPLDEHNWGVDGMMANMLEYVKKDIEYAKQHASLKNLACTWDAREHLTSLLVGGKEAVRWQQWLGFAAAADMKPRPTELQKAYVAESVRKAERRRRNVRALGFAVIALMVFAAVFTSILAVQARAAEQKADSSAKLAAAWTVLGNIGRPSGSVSELRGLILVLKISSDRGSGAFRDLRAEAARIFYRILSGPAVNTGEMDGLVRSWGAAWSPDGSTLAAASEMDGNPVVLQPLQGTLDSRRWLGPHSAPIHGGLSWSESSGLLAAAALDGSVYVLDPSANVSKELPGGRAGAWLQAESTRSPVAWIRNGSALVSSGGPSAPLRLWDRLEPPGTFTEVVSPEQGNNSSSPIPASGGRPDKERTSIAASPDGLLLASTSLVGAVDLWQLHETGGIKNSGYGGLPTHLQRLPLKAQGVHASFSSDGKTLAVVQHGRPPDRLQLYHLNRPWLMQTNNDDNDDESKHGKVLGGPAHTRVTPTGQSGPRPAAPAPAAAAASSGVDACPDSCGSFDIVESGWARRLWDSNSPYEESLSSDARLHLSHLGWDMLSWAKCVGCRKNHWGQNATACVADLYLSGRAASRCPASQLASWEDLGDIERLSAQNLGFTAATWAATSPFSCCTQEPLLRDHHYGDDDNPPYSPSGHHHSKIQEPMTRATTGDDKNTLLSPSGNNTRTQQQQPYSMFESLGPLQLEPDSQELVFSSEYSPDGKRIAAGTGLGALVWDLSGASGPLPAKLPGAHTNGVHWSPDSRLLAAPQSNGYVGIWDFGLEQSGRVPVVQLKPRLGSAATGVAFSPRQDLLVSGSSGGELQVRRSPDASYNRHGASSASETPDSRQETIFLEGISINDLVFSPDGAMLAAASQNYSSGLGGGGAVVIWSVNSINGTLQKVLEVQTQQTLSGVSFSPDGTKMAATHGSFNPPEERGVILWETESLLDGCGSGNSSTVTKNDTQHSHLLPTAGLPRRAAFSPDGRILACATEEGPTSSPNFLFWEVESGKELNVTGLSLRPFGPSPLTMDWLPSKERTTGGTQTYTLAVAGRDFSLSLLEMEYQKGAKAKVERIQELRAHGDTDVYSVKWSPDGSMLASAGVGGQVLLWEAPSSSKAEAPLEVTQRLDLGESGRYILSLSWDREGQWLAAAGYGGSVKVAKVTPIDDMAAAVEGVILPFTRKEFRAEDAALLGITTNEFDVMMTILKDHDAPSGDEGAHS